MDPYSFASPSRLRFSVVPINKLKRAQYKEYVNLLRKVDEARLVDLSPSQGLFNPQAYPQGRIIYNFGTAGEDTESLFLQDFEPFRKIFGVIGITQWSDQITDDTLSKFLEELKKEYPNSISHFIMVFDCPPDFIANGENIHVVHINMENIETAICDLSSSLLESLSVYASSYQHVTLRSPGTISGNSLIRSNTSLIEKQKRRISGTLDISPDKIKQHKTKGRRLKISANFYLLAGNLKNAVTDFCEAIHNLRYAHDHLWLASSLDGLAVCIILLTYIEVPFQLPPLILSFIDNSKEAAVSPFTSPSPTASPRPSFQSAAHISNTNIAALPQPATSYPMSSIPELLSKIMNKVLLYYRLTIGQTEDYVPQVVFCETNLRYIKLLTCISVEGQFNHKVLSHVIYDSPLSKKCIDEEDITDNTLIYNLGSDVFNDQFKELAVSQRYMIYNSMISIYSQLKLKRKMSLLIKELIDLTVSTDILDPNHMYISDNIEELIDSHLQVYGIRIDTKSDMISTNLLQKNILKSVMKFCQKIGSSKGVMKYGSILLRDFYKLSTDGEQISVFKTVKALMYESEVTEHYYWDSGMFQNIELTGQNKDKLIQDELSDAVITLRNPFAFEVDISELEISTRDNFPIHTHISLRKQSLESVQSKISIILKPRSITPVSVYIEPKSNGELKIIGIRATVCSCKRQLFAPPEMKPSYIIKVKSFNAENSLQPVSTSATEADVLSSKVLYEQPLLSLVDVKLNNRWIMLLEGECKRFEIILKNSSNVEINQLTSRFLDSTIEPLNQLLSNKGLSPNEVYEIEYYLIRKKPFHIRNKADMSRIKGNSEFKLEIEIWGKRGVKEASLLLEYSHQRPKEKVAFARNLKVPIKVTVYPSIELVGCDIIPLSSTTKISETNEGDCWKYLNLLTKEDYEMSDFCLLALDFMNSWTEVIEITFQSLLKGSEDPAFQESNGIITEEFDHTFCTKITLPSKKNARILIPIKRMDFSFEYLDQRIPSLRNRQFIVDTKTPEEEQRFIKHAFWYRDELLKRIRANWKIPDSVDNSMYAGRAGTIDLRSIRFSSKMMNALEVEKLGIMLSLHHSSGEPAVNDNVQLNEFYTIRVTIINRNQHPVNGMIRHVPISRSSSISIEKKILYNGVLQFSIENEVKSSEARVFKLGVTFLEKGEYEWGAIFDEMDGFDTGVITIIHQHSQREQLKIRVV